MRTLGLDVHRRFAEVAVHAEGESTRIGRVELAAGSPVRRPAGSRGPHLASGPGARAQPVDRGSDRGDQDARAAASLPRPDPLTTQLAGRDRRHSTQAGGPDLAPAHQRRGLPPRSADGNAPQATRTRGSPQAHRPAHELGRRHRAQEGRAATARAGRTTLLAGGRSSEPPLTFSSAPDGWAVWPAGKDVWGVASHCVVWDAVGWNVVPAIAVLMLVGLLTVRG